MLPSIQLKNQATAWNNKARYKVRSTVIHNAAYWVNATGINTEPVDSNPDWVSAGSVVPVGIDGKRTYKYILITADAGEIQDNELIGATEVTMITSTVSGIQMKSSITFAPLTGTIESFPVVTGDEFVIFYTKS